MTDPDSDSCRPVEIDGEIIRVRGSGDMSTESQAALAEVIRAAKRRFAAEHPARLTVDTITSDQLDALQDQLAEALEGQRDLGASVNHWADLATRHQHWGQRRWNAWKSARRRGRHAVPRETHDRLWSEFGKERERAEQAEAAIERVRALHADWLSDGAPPIGTSIARWWDRRLIQLAAALDEPKEPTPPTFTLLHHACGQLADIPGDVTLHPGRLSWPGHDCPADTPKEPTS